VGPSLAERRTGGPMTARAVLAFLSVSTVASLVGCVPSNTGSLTLNPSAVTAAVAETVTVEVETVFPNWEELRDDGETTNLEVTISEAHQQIVQFVGFDATTGFGGAQPLAIPENEPETVYFIGFAPGEVDRGTLRLSCVTAGTASVVVSSYTTASDHYFATLSVTCTAGAGGNGITHIGGAVPTDNGSDCWGVDVDQWSEFLSNRPAGDTGDVTMEFTIEDGVNNFTQRFFFLIDGSDGALVFADGFSVVLREFNSDYELSILGETTTERVSIPTDDLGTFPLELALRVVWDNVAGTATASLSATGTFVADLTHPGLGLAGGDDVGWSIDSSEVCVSEYWPL